MTDLNLFIASANEDFKIVVIQFANNSKPYHYKTTLDVQADDFVVVASPTNGLQVVKVIEIINPLETDLTTSYTLKWLVSKVDLDYYDKCKLMEKEANKALNKLRASQRSKELLANVQDQIGEDGVESIKAITRL